MIFSLQILGQTVLGFKVSIAQILISIGLCAVIEIGVTYWRRGILAVPASAMLTGNSIALLLRTTGTQHGDWWSLNGIQYFALAAVVALLSKYLIRPGGRHIYNPSNFGLVACLLAFGPAHVFPQYLWWGPMNLPVAVAWAVILLGGIWVLWSLKMVPMVTSFLVPFICVIAAFAVQDQCFYAVWRATPVCGANYWLGIAASPELLVFVLLMMSDPRTAPSRRWARAMYGAATALIAAALIYPQATEFGVKVALLGSLVIVCSLIPVLDPLMGRLSGSSPSPAPSPDNPGATRPPSGFAHLFRAAAVLLIVITTPAAVLSLSSNAQVLRVDHPSAPNAPGLQ